MNNLLQKLFRNRVGNFGLALSLLGLVSMQLCSAPELIWLLQLVSLACPAGLIVGLIGVFRVPRWPARWAMLLGFLGSLYIPTIWLPYLHKV